MEVVSASIAVNDIKINKTELALRLKTPVGFENESLKSVLDSCEAELNRVCAARYVYMRFPVNTDGESMTDFGFAKFYSHDLCKCLKGCNYAYIMAVTLGIGVDRMLSSMRVSSQSKFFAADALCSAAAEAAADFVSEALAERCTLGPRYSPGYGDLALSVQRDILTILNADKLLGIKLGDNLLMTPTKSITAIQGERPQNT